MPLPAEIGPVRSRHHVLPLPPSPHPESPRHLARRKRDVVAVAVQEFGHGRAPPGMTPSAPPARQSTYVIMTNYVVAQAHQHDRALASYRRPERPATSHSTVPDRTSATAPRRPLSTPHSQVAMRHRWSMTRQKVPSPKDIKAAAQAAAETAQSAATCDPGLGAVHRSDCAPLGRDYVIVTKLWRGPGWGKRS